MGDSLSRGRTPNALARCATPRARRLHGRGNSIPVWRPPLPASAVLTSSGTMSMQCALAGIPGAVVYRANPVTYLIGRWLVRVPYLGIANLLLEKPMYPEYIQNAATPNALASELRSCLHDPERRARAAVQAEDLRKALGQPSGGTAGDWLCRQLG